MSAAFDMAEKLIAAFSVFLPSSSLNPISNIQCRLFSTSQCDLTDLSMVTGSGSNKPYEDVIFIGRLLWLWSCFLNPPIGIISLFCPHALIFRLHAFIHRAFRY